MKMDLADFERVECYQCGRDFGAMDKLAVHQFYEPGHFVSVAMREMLPEGIR